MIELENMDYLNRKRDKIIYHLSDGHFYTDFPSNTRKSSIEKRLQKCTIRRYIYFFLSAIYYGNPRGLFSIFSNSSNRVNPLRWEKPNSLVPLKAEGLV